MEFIETIKTATTVLAIMCLFLRWDRCMMHYRRHNFPFSALCKIKRGDNT